MRIIINNILAELLITKADAMTVTAAFPSTAFLDCSQPPLASLPHMPLTLEHVQQWLADMQALMDAGQRFVLFYPVVDMQQQGDPEGRRTVVLWLKAQRALFADCCKGMLMQCQADGSDRAALLALSTPLAKAYGVPVAVVDSPAQALAQAQALVNGE